jgi:hypothetical protein
MHVPHPNFKPKAREKSLEPALRTHVEKQGGTCVKLPSTVNLAGIPDRLCLFPGGICVFAEIKSEGKKPSKIQLVIHGQLRKLGFRVYVISTKEQLKQFKKSECYKDAI